MLFKFIQMFLSAKTVSLIQILILSPKYFSTKTTILRIVFHILFKCLSQPSKPDSKNSIPSTFHIHSNVYPSHIPPLSSPSPVFTHRMNLIQTMPPSGFI